MNKRFSCWMITAACLLALPAAAHAVLIWDVAPGDGAAITDGPGDWLDGGGNWNDGTTDATWSNAAPDVAQFGTAVSSAPNTVMLGMGQTIKASGIVSYMRYTFNDALGGSAKIELQGPTPSVETFQQTTFYVGIATAPDVQSVRFTGTGTSTRYLSFYGANTLDAPAIIGPDVPNTDGFGLLAMQYHNDSLGGSSAAGITVNAGTTLSFRSQLLSTAKSFTIAGDGYGSRSALQFYSYYDDRVLQGSVTLAADASIELSGTSTISGQISGDYAITFRNSYTNAVGGVHLTNGANSTKNLVVHGDHGADALVTVMLDAPYTATESATVKGDGKVVLGTATSLVTPLVVLESTSSVLDASAAGLSLGAGQTLQGNGQVLGNVAAGDGSMITPGVTAGTLTVTGDLDMSAGADMTWSLATLTDNATGVAGADFDVTAVAGNLALGATSELTLDFSVVGDPSAADPFWASDHTWTIINVDDTLGTTTGTFASIVNGTYASGNFATAVDAGGDVLLSYIAQTLPPVPGDTDNNRIVNELDAQKVASNWGAPVTGGAADGDFNDDDIVNAADASILAANWGNHTGEGLAAGVPEPSAIVLLAGLAVLLAGRRQR